MEVAQAEEEVVQVGGEVDVAEEDQEEELQAVGEWVGDAGHVEGEGEKEGEGGDYGEGF